MPFKQTSEPLRVREAKDPGLEVLDCRVDVGFGVVVCRRTLCLFEPVFGRVSLMYGRSRGLFEEHVLLFH